MIRLINSTLLKDHLLSEDIISSESNQSGASLDRNWLPDWQRRLFAPTLRPQPLEWTLK